MTHLTSPQIILEAAPFIKELNVYYADEPYADENIEVESIPHSSPGALSEVTARTHVYAKQFNDATEWVFNSLHVVRSSSPLPPSCDRFVMCLNDIAEAIQDHVDGLSDRLTEVEATLVYSPTEPYLMLDPEPGNPPRFTTSFAFARELMGFRSGILRGVKWLAIRRRFEPRTSHARAHRAKLKAIAAAASPTANLSVERRARP